MSAKPRAYWKCTFPAGAVTTASGAVSAALANLPMELRDREVEVTITLKRKR